MRSWLLLTYKIPPKPTALRVSIWRKLRKLGAVLLHDTVWVLPATPATEHHFQWLAAEIREMKGEAFLWRAETITDQGDEQLVRRFSEAANDLYRRLLGELDRAGADRAALIRHYQQARAVDYFGSVLGERVRKRLIGSRRKPSRRKGDRR